jgi:hypothetical protein
MNMKTKIIISIPTLLQNGVLIIRTTSEKFRWNFRLTTNVF